MKKISVIGATLVAAAVLCAAPISLHQSQDKGLTLSVDKARARIGRPLTPGSVAGVHRRYERRAYRGGYYGQGYYGRGYYGGGYGLDIMAAGTATDIMATVARRQRHSPVRRRPSSNSRRIGSPATPPNTSASKPGRPRRPPKHNQQNKIEIAKKGTRSGPFLAIAIATTMSILCVSSGRRRRRFARSSASSWPWPATRRRIVGFDGDRSALRHQNAGARLRARPRQKQRAGR